MIAKHKARFLRITGLQLWVQLVAGCEITALLKRLLYLTSCDGLDLGPGTAPFKLFNLRKQRLYFGAFHLMELACVMKQVPYLRVFAARD